MRRFVFSAVLLVLSLPVGLSTTGCINNYGQNYCSGFQSGPMLTAVYKIDLEPATYGISLSYGQISTTLAPSAENCKGTAVTVTNYTYGNSNLSFGDVCPTGRV